MEDKIKILEFEEKDLNFSKIENKDLNTSKDVVDENIRKSKLKEIKVNKELVEQRLINLDEQVQHLIEEEEEHSPSKKFNVKMFLENFEQDKLKAEQKALKWEKERISRLKNLNEQQIKIEEKIKVKLEKSEKEIKEKENKRNEEYLKHLEKIKEKTKKKREEILNLKDEWSNKEVVNNQYRYEIAEANFKKKQENIKEEQKVKLNEYIQNKKQHLKPINKEELDDFQSKYEEERQRLILEKEKLRFLKQEEILNSNFALPKKDSKAYFNFKEKEKKEKEKKEKEKLDKIYNSMKIKQFSEVVYSSMLPKVDEGKKQELELRVKKLNDKKGKENHRKKSKKKNRILLKKRSPENEKKYKWNLKLLNKSSEENKNFNKRSNSALSKKINLEHNENINNHSNNILNKSRSKSAEKRKPLEKLPNYLNEFKAKRKDNIANGQTNKSKYNLV